MNESNPPKEHLSIDNELMETSRNIEELVLLQQRIDEQLKAQVFHHDSIKQKMNMQNKSMNHHLPTGQIKSIPTNVEYHPIPPAPTPPNIIHDYKFAKRMQDSNADVGDSCGSIESSSTSSSSNAVTPSRILAQNLSRLSDLKKEMASPKGYEETCKELGLWCDDQRAYSMEFAGDLNRVFEKLFHFAFLKDYNFLSGYRVLNIAQKYSHLMMLPAQENIQTWLTLMKKYIEATSQLDKTNIIDEIKLLQSVCAYRQATLSSASAIVIKNILSSDNMSGWKAIHQLSLGNTKKLSNSGSKTHPIPSKFPCWIENSIEPFHLLPDATNVDVSFTMSSERIKYFDSCEQDCILYKLRLVCHKTQDKYQRQEWPLSLLSVEMNSFKVPLQRKITSSHRPTRNVGFHYPADLSSFLRVGSNTLKLQFQPDIFQKDYSMHVEVTALLSLEKSIETVLETQKLSEADAISFYDKLIKPLADEEVQTIHDSIDLDLKCPISLRKIKNPVRGSECIHPRCFDLETWLQSHLKSIYYNCPLCCKPLTIDKLRMDSFLKKIIDSTEPHMCIIRMELCGKWTSITTETNADKSNSNTHDPPSLPSMDVDTHEQESKKVKI